MTAAAPPDYRVAIVGAGPLGISVAAHLRDGGITPFICGHPMEFWRQQMPRGMLLRSPIRASSIASPRRELALDRWSAAEGTTIGTELPLSDFISYGDWFRRQAELDVDLRLAASISVSGDGFLLVLEDGSEVRADKVVVAGGIGRFAYFPPELRGLPAELVSHSSQQADLATFAGRHVAVLGSGQSAIESTALLHEGGADVELIFRSQAILWLDKPPPWRLPSMQAATGVGGPRASWLVASPDLFRLFPKRWQPPIAYHTIRPAGAVWLRPRTSEAGVPMTASTTVRNATPQDGQLRLELSNGKHRLVDHLLLATGYEIDIRKYEFLPADLVDRLEMVKGYPVLRPGLESSLPGLYFVGAPAAISFGPVMRFVTGAQYAAPAVARHLLGQPQPRVAWSY
ncbi:MAG TPA: NAD(P)-binding domain-containing protein [Solirubrobacteraceae bacterium]|nr:NAD(P)-binding domain-containing protein [Solirubrobacteraceae bacterium]